MLPHQDGSPYCRSPMDSRAFLGLRPSHNPYRWSLEVGAGLVTGAASCSAGAASARPSRRWRARAAASASGRRRSTSRTPTAGEVVDIDVTIAVEGHQITQARAVCHVGEPGDPDRQRRARPPPARAGRSVGATCPDGLPRPQDCPPRPQHGPIDGHDQRAAGPAHRQGPRAATQLDGTPRRRPGADLDAHPRRARRRRRHRARRPRRLRADGRGPGARGPRRRQQPRQHPAGRAPRADRVGAARHPGPRRRAGLRPRPRPHVRRGRHAAGHGQPELHRAVLGPAAPRAHPPIQEVATHEPARSAPA